MENQKNANAVAASAEDKAVLDVSADTRKKGARLRIYKKKSTFKGATDKDFWYSGTTSGGNSVICVFKCDIPDDFIDEKAFEIDNIMGGRKVKTVEKDGEVYENHTYYIDSCDFHKIDPEPLPV